MAYHYIKFNSAANLTVDHDSVLDFDQSFELSGDVATISFWINTVDDSAVILKKMDGLSYGWKISIVDEKIEFRATGKDILNRTKSVICESSGVSVNDSKWHFVCISIDKTYDATLSREKYLVKINIDDDIESFDVFTSLWYDLSNDGLLHIGDNTFIGSIDDIRVYKNLCLTESQISNLYNYGMGTKVDEDDFLSLYDGVSSSLKQGWYTEADEEVSSEIISKKLDSSVWSDLNIDGIDDSDVTWEEGGIPRESHYYLDFGGVDSLSFSTGTGNQISSSDKVSICFWFKSTNIRYVSNLFDYDDFSIKIQADGKILVQTGTNNLYSTSAVDTEQWIHLCVTYNDSPSTMKLYLDDTEVDTESVSASGFDNGSSFSVGGSNFVGSIDDVRIYKGITLLSSQIGDIYNNSNGNEINLDNEDEVYSDLGIAEANLNCFYSNFNDIGNDYASGRMAVAGVWEDLDSDEILSTIAWGDYGGSGEINNERTLLRFGESVDVNVNTKIKFNYLDGINETATVVVRGVSYTVANNTSDNFVWDQGGRNQHTFTTVGESFTFSVSGTQYTVIYQGAGSHLFDIYLFSIIEIPDMPAPTLTYPLGNEQFNQETILVQWEEPSAISSSSKLYWYEIFVSDNDRDWIQIATIPKGKTSFNWKINSNFKSKKCKIGIRTVDVTGSRSIIVNSYYFSVRDKRLPIPAVYSPVENGKYFSYLPIILDAKGLIGQCSKRAYYQVYYHSEEQSIDWTLLRGDIPSDSPTVYVDLRDFDSSIDYMFKFELVDGNNISKPVFVKNVTINNLNYFKIDTVAPTGTIKILNNSEYINEINLVAQLNSYDSTTGVESYRISQKDMDTSDETVIDGPFLGMTDLATLTLGDGTSVSDGVKLIQASFKDFAGNTLLPESGKFYFRTYKEINDEEITSLLIEKNVNEDNGDNVWIAFGGTSPSLYLNRTLISTLSGKVSALSFYDDILYIAIINEDNKGVLQRYIGGEIETIYEIDSNFESVINSMTIFDDKLFLGCENGYFYSFNGSSITTEYNGVSFGTGINALGTNQNSLFIFLKNSEYVYIMSKDLSNNYQYTSVQI